MCPYFNPTGKRPLFLVKCQPSLTKQMCNGGDKSLIEITISKRKPQHLCETVVWKHSNFLHYGTKALKNFIQAFTQRFTRQYLVSPYNSWEDPSQYLKQKNFGQNKHRHRFLHQHICTDSKLEVCQPCSNTFKNETRPNTIYNKCWYCKCHPLQS